jgi:hypothetical protein
MRSLSAVTFDPTVELRGSTGQVVVTGEFVDILGANTATLPAIRMQAGPTSGTAHAGDIDIIDINGTIWLQTSNVTIQQGTTGQTQGNLNITNGNVLINTGFFLGDGSKLVNLPVQPGTYSNANVASYLPTYTGSLDLSSSIVNLVANAATQSIQINSLATGANANTAAYLPGYTGNITSVSFVTASGNITATTGGYFMGDGSKLTNLPQSGASETFNPFLLAGM